MQWQSMPDGVDVRLDLREPHQVLNKFKSLLFDRQEQGRWVVLIDIVDIQTGAFSIDTKDSYGCFQKISVAIESKQVDQLSFSVVVLKVFDIIQFRELVEIHDKL